MAITAKDWKQSKYPYIKIHKKDKDKYLFDIRLNGKRHRKQYKSDSSKDIYTIFLEWSDKVGTKTTDDAVTVKDYFELSQRLSERSKSTKRYYEQYLNLYLTSISSFKIQDVKSSHIDAINLKTAHLSRRSRKTVFEILIPIFRIAIDDGIIDKTPIKQRQIVKRKPLEEMRIVTDAVSKYKLLHKAIHETYEDDAKIRAIFLFGFYGRRKGEVLGLKWSDINMLNGTYIVQGSMSKVSADMTFVLADDLKEALTEIMSSTSPYVFKSKFSDEPISNIDWHIKKIRDRTFPEFTFHLMRNIAVSALSASGANALDLSSMLGHLDSNTLKKYLSLQREGASKKTNSISEQLLFG